MIVSSLINYYWLVSGLSIQYIYIAVIEILFYSARNEEELQ